MATLTSWLRQLTLPFKWQLILIISLTFLSYATIFDNELIGDDRDFIQNWTTIREVANIPELLAGDVPEPHQGNYRPIRSLFYVLVFQLSGTNVVGYHIFSILVHLANTVLVFLLVRKLTTKKSLVPFVSAALFGTHPIHLEAITFITASFDSIAFAFMLGSFYLYLSNLPQARLNSGALLLYALAAGTNEITYAYPVLLCVYHYLYKPLSVSEFKQRVLPFFLVVMALVTLRFGFLQIATRSDYAGGSFYFAQLISLKVIVYYLYLLVLPIKLGLIHKLPNNISTYTFSDINYDIVRQQSLFEPMVLLSLLLIGVSAWLFFYWRKQQPLLSLSIAWFFIFLLPSLNLIPSAVYLSERYVYLSSIGFVIIIAVLLNRIGAVLKPLRSQATLGLSLLLIGAYTGLSLYHNQFWQDEVVYWQKNVREYPDNFLAQYQLGQVFHSRYLLTEAAESYQHAIALQPDYIKSHHNLGLIQHFLGAYDAAINNYQHVLDKYPDSDVAKINQSLSYTELAKVYLLQNQPEHAETNLSLALRQDPRNPVAARMLQRLCHETTYTCQQNTSAVDAVERTSPLNR